MPVAMLMVTSANRITAIEEGKTLVSTKGSTPLKAVQHANRERLLRVTIFKASDPIKGVEMVEKGESGAFVMDDVAVRLGRRPP